MAREFAVSRGPPIQRRQFGGRAEEWGVRDEQCDSSGTESAKNLHIVTGLRRDGGYNLRTFRLKPELRALALALARSRAEDRQRPKGKFVLRVYRDTKGARSPHPDFA